VIIDIEQEIVRGELLMLVTELLSELAEREARRDWWEAAACRTADPDMFFPVSTLGPGQDEVARAKAVCAECRVRRQCLQFALATHQSHGVWGGTTEEERRVQLHRQQTRDDHETLADPEEAATEGSV
jgi:WhiB family redox-sensing transcriptional regulator